MNARSTRQVIYRLLPGHRREYPEPIILVVPPPPVTLETSALDVTPSTPPPVISPIVSTLFDGFITGFEEQTASLVDAGWNQNRTPLTTVRPGIGTERVIQLGGIFGGSIFRSTLVGLANGMFHTRAYFQPTIVETIAGVYHYEIFGTTSHAAHLDFNYANRRMRVYAAGTSVVGSYQVISGHWYRLELECSKQVAGYTRLRLYDGDSMTLLEDITVSANTTGGANDIVTLGHDVQGGGRTVALLFDDVGFLRCPDWIGPGTTYTRPPISEVAVQWLPEGAASNLLAVLGVPGPLTPASYAKTTVAGRKDSYLVSLAGIDPYQRIGFTQVQGRALMSGGNNGTLRGYEKDNAGTIWNGTTRTITFQNFLQQFGTRQWNLPSVGQFATWEVGYECVSPGGIEMRIPDLWYQADIQNAP